MHFSFPVVTWKSGFDRTCRRSSGFTLVELLVSIAIIIALTALLLPAIQMVRESGRRTVCMNNIRQLAIGSLNYESAHETLPAGSDGAHSFIARILPFVEEGNIASQIDFRGIGPQSSVPIESIGIPLLLCPSDSENHILPDPELHPTNYVGNAGTGFQRYGYNGAFSQYRPIALSEFSDGTSNTAMISECLVGTSSDDRLRVLFKGPRMGDPDQLDDFADICKEIEQYDTTKSYWSRGRPWNNGSDLFTFYNHVNGPGYPNCTNDGDIKKGIYPANSEHPGGVVVVKADASVEFVASSIDQGIWRSLGSRDESSAN